MNIQQQYFSLHYFKAINMYKVFFIVFFSLILLSCGSRSQHKGKNQSIPLSVSDRMPLKRIRLYAVNTVFNKYLPDTSLSFTNPNELRKYYLSNFKNFKDFCNRLEESSGNQDSIGLSVKQAEILYQDLAEVNYMEFYKTWKKDNRNMNMLAAFSPHSKIISIQERINFFKTFPVEIQNNEVGEKTWKRLTEYSFDRNLGANITRFNNARLIKTDLKETTFGQSLIPNHKYSIIVFGASWCSPCRLEEMQLKNWQPFIDTSLVKIIGLSIDADKIKWKNYLAKDKLPWDCYLLPGSMDNEMIKQLQFEGIPMNFLINAEGEILAENTDIRKILNQIPEMNTE